VPKLKPSCIIASNTSSISITRLGAATDRPEKFIGMHFMNPVPVMKLVEIIRGIATDEPTFLAVQALARKLGKIAAVAEDFPAFIVNRILVPMINEAVYALYEGVGSVSGSTRPCGLARTIRWGRWSWRISSGWIRACRSCRCCMMGCRTASTGRARCW
jgi:3-hydroxybutyryl-CoA dehydrogenase